MTMLVAHTISQHTVSMGNVQYKGGDNHICIQKLLDVNTLWKHMARAWNATWQHTHMGHGMDL